MGHSPKLITLGPQHTLAVSALNFDCALPTIVLLNGSAFNYRQWDNIISHGFKPQIAQDFTVIRYDYGRSGLSTSPVLRWNLRDMAQELAQLLDYLKVDRAHLYGISKGTIVAQAFSRWHPQRIASLGGYGWYFHRYSKLEALSRRFIKRVELFKPLDPIANQELTYNNFEALWREVYREIVFSKPLAEFSIKERLFDFIMRRKLYPLLAPTPVAVIRDWFLYALNEMPQVFEELDKIKQNLINTPILIQHAQNDETLPVGMARELHAWLPNSNLIEYPAPYTHLSPAIRREQARKIVGDYMTFLQSQQLQQDSTDLPLAASLQR